MQFSSSSARAPLDSGSEAATPAPQDSLFEALCALREADPENVALRERAARRFCSEMERWAPAVLRSAFGDRWGHALGPRSADFIADAVQGVALAASSSAHHFRGQNEASARAWCRKLLVSHVANELRARRSRIPLVEVPAQLLPATEQDLESMRPAASVQLVDALRLLQSVRAIVMATHRPRDAESTMRAVWCYLEYVSGATLEEQVRAVCGKDGDRRSKNRVYKLRERGKRAIQTVCAALEQEQDNAVQAVFTALPPLGT